MPLGARPRSIKKCEQNIVTKFLYTLDDILGEGVAV